MNGEKETRDRGEDRRKTSGWMISKGKEEEQRKSNRSRCRALFERAATKKTGDFHWIVILESDRNERHVIEAAGTKVVWRGLSTWQPAPSSGPIKSETSMTKIMIR